MFISEKLGRPLLGPSPPLYNLPPPFERIRQPLLRFSPPLSNPSPPPLKECIETCLGFRPPLTFLPTLEECANLCLGSQPSSRMSHPFSSGPSGKQGSSPTWRYGLNTSKKVLITERMCRPLGTSFSHGLCPLSQKGRPPPDPQGHLSNLASVI